MTTQFPIIVLILAALALIISAYCVWQIVTINKLRKTFFEGRSAISLEDVIYSLKQEMGESQNKQDLLEQGLVRLKVETALAIQKVGLIRFNPFNDGGGNFSFCLALLDQKDSGIIITSMYGREQNRIYTKRVSEGKCEIQLTEEEQQAMTAANTKI